MKKFIKAISLSIVIVATVFLTQVYAFEVKDNISVKDFIHKAEYSEEYIRWTELSNSQKERTISPKIYNNLETKFIATNPLYQVNLVGAGLTSRFDLRDKIEDNISVKNQYNTASCWAFAGLSSLETNLALNNNNEIYDYSERHVNYATTRFFANNELNDFGFNRLPSSGGQWFLIENYLTNGQGAIDEADMPFEDNSNIINISEIEDKDTQTRVYDTIYFENYNNLSDNDRIEEMNKIKQHIEQNGSVFASIHGYALNSESNCYNYETGAKYCSDKENHPVDHAVSIIGWDDNYDVENFSDGMRPNSNGAWIVRNSWGEYSGYMYISYEDANIGETLYGIENATDELDYDYIYQYNELYPALEISLRTNATFICNVFDKESSNTEYLTGVALTAPETYTCKVYVNPNGTSKSKTDMKAVQLQAGASEKIEKGYHTLEFAEPVEITGNQFTIAVEVSGTRDELNVQMEGKTAEVELFDYVKTETGKCFVSSTTDFETCTWFDLGTLESANAGLTNGDSSIKAFVIEDDISTDSDTYKTEVDNVPEEMEKVTTESTDFSNANCKINSIKAYYYTNNSAKDYTLINTEINGIERSTNNDKYEYYYYLSPNANLTNIGDWVKISQQQTSSTKLSFFVDSRELPNYDEVLKSKSLYIYIKEVVTRDGEMREVFSKGLKYEKGNAEIETYIDGVLTTNEKNGYTENNNNNESNNGKESLKEREETQQIQGKTAQSTNLPEKLPYTGNAKILIVILIVTIVGVAIFVRYEILNKYVK